MSELPEKQVKRLKALLNEAETNLAAARELLTSLVGDDSAIDFSHREDPVTFSSSGDPDVSGAGTDQFPYKRRILIKNDRTFKERNPLGIEIHDRRDRGNSADPAYDLTGG